MKKILISLALTFSAYFAQSQCPNLNFSMGNFTNWQGYIGSCRDSININPSAITPGRHTIMHGAQLLAANQLYDEHCLKIKKVPDNFAYSAKIGNAGTGAEMEALEYTMTVDSINSLLLIHYAWVMEDPSHNPEEQPRFSIQIRDSNGNAIPETNRDCWYSFIEPNFPDLACKTSPLGRDWTTIGYSLKSLIGQTIKIYFETRDCTGGGHFGYAYVVTECRSLSIDLLYCSGQTYAYLSVPVSFSYYKWTRSSDLSWVSEGENLRTIRLENPIDGEIITCEMGSIGPECKVIMHNVIEKTLINVNFAFGVMDSDGYIPFREHGFRNWYDTCSRTATFVDRSMVINSKQASRSWTIHGLNMAFPKDSIITVNFPDPGLRGLDSVRYLVCLTVTSENGCKDTTSQHITIYSSSFVNSIRVNSLDAHFTSSQKIYCNNTPVTFTNKSNADILFTKYDCHQETNIFLIGRWDWGDGTYSEQRYLMGTNPIIEHQFNLPNEKTEVIVTLQVKIEGYNDYEAIYKDTLLFFPRPIAAFTDDGHEFSSCSDPQDKTVQFRNQSQGNIEQLIWNFGDTISGNVNEISGSIDNLQIANPSHIYKNAAGKYNVSLIAIDSNQCMDTITKPNLVDIFGVKGDFNYSVRNCIPTTATFTFTVPDNHLEPEYIPDSIVVHTNGASYATLVSTAPSFSSRSVLYRNAGTYFPTCFVYKTISFNGQKEMCVLELKGKDSIYAIDLTPDFEIANYYHPDSPVVFTNISILEPTGFPYDSVIWDFGNGDLSYDYNGTTIYSDTGEYVVKLKMQALQCAKERTRTIIVNNPNVPISDITNGNSSIVVYPNPASTLLHVKFDKQEIMDYSIYNVMGQIILQGKLQEDSVINIEFLAKGMYYLKIAGKENGIIKFVKQ